MTKQDFNKKEIKLFLDSAKIKASHKFDELKKKLDLKSKRFRFTDDQKKHQGDPLYLLAHIINMNDVLQHPKNKIKKIASTHFEHLYNVVSAAEKPVFNIESNPINELSNLLFNKSFREVVDEINANQSTVIDQRVLIDPMFIGQYTGWFLRPESVGGGGFRVGKIYISIESYKITFITSHWKGEAISYNFKKRERGIPGNLTAIFINTETQFPFLFSFVFDKDKKNIFSVCGEYSGTFPPNDHIEALIPVSGHMMLEKITDERGNSTATNYKNDIIEKMKLPRLNIDEDCTCFKDVIEKIITPQPNIFAFLQQGGNRGTTIFSKIENKSIPFNKEFLIGDYSLLLLSDSGRILRELPFRIDLTGSTYLKGFGSKIYEGKVSFEKETVIISTFRKYDIEKINVIKTSSNLVSKDSHSISKLDISIYDRDINFINEEPSFYNYYFTANWLETKKGYLKRKKFIYEGIRSGVEIVNGFPLSSCRFILSPKIDSNYFDQSMPSEVDLKRPRNEVQKLAINILKKRRDEENNYINNNVILVNEENMIHFLE